MSVIAVIVTYHTGDVLWACLEEAVRQCDRVVVVSNGNPAEVERRLADDGRWELRSGHGNIGFASAVNRGAEGLGEDHILVLNPDAVMQDGCVARLVEVAEGLPAPTVVGARLVDENGVELRGSRRRALTPWTLFRGLNLHRRPLPSEPLEVGAVSGAAMLMSRGSWEALGGFDTHYFLHVEDLDICRRAGRAVFVPDAEVVHPGSTSDVPSWVVETHKYMGLRRYFTRHNPVLGRLVLVPIYLAFRARMRPSGGSGA